MDKQDIQGLQAFFFLSQRLVINIRNVGSKESLGVKFKEGICAKSCVKLWFESNWYFCNSIKTGGL